MPVRDPQNEFPGTPGIAFLLALPNILEQETLNFLNFPTFPWKGLWGRRFRSFLRILVP